MGIALTHREFFTSTNSFDEARKNPDRSVFFLIARENRDLSTWFLGPCQNSAPETCRGNSQSPCLEISVADAKSKNFAGIASLQPDRPTVDSENPQKINGSLKHPLEFKRGSAFLSAPLCPFPFFGPLS
jgi:hypothetical protein